jgi:crotonobetainyl-CoA:carnitine CoA-transferase CaiB-like acyl-CoA transferase
MSSALGHLKVLDLSRVLAGPWASQNLADLGADVIKVERPGNGDDTRAWGPPYVKDAEGQETRDSSYFLSANRGKKSVTLDLSKPEGQQLVRSLARESDVLLENYKVGTLARYGLGYEDLRVLNPRLIYCSVSGFGQDGPCAHLPGYDFIFQGMGGLMSITGLPEREPGGVPVKSGIAVVDLFAGMYATTAILAALERRHASGEGQHIDISLFDCIVGISSYQALNYFLSGRVPQRLGNGHSTLVPYQVFHCSDGDLIVAMGNDTQFVAFCDTLALPELSDDPRFKTAGARNRNRGVLLPLIEKVMLTRSVEEWHARMERAGIPAGPIYNLKQTFEHPQVKHRGMKIDLPHSSGQKVPNVANPMRFSESPIRYGRAAPELGEHTTAVLRDRLKLSAEQIAQLRLNGVI